MSRQLIKAMFGKIRQHTAQCSTACKTACTHAHQDYAFLCDWSAAASSALLAAATVVMLQHTLCSTVHCSSAVCICPCMHTKVRQERMPTIEHSAVQCSIHSKAECSHLPLHVYQGQRWHPMAVSLQLLSPVRLQKQEPPHSWGQGPI